MRGGVCDTSTTVRAVTQSTAVSGTLALRDPMAGHAVGCSTEAWDVPHSTPRSADCHRLELARFPSVTEVIDVLLSIRRHLAAARRNYAGTSPITRASGTRRIVLARYARNRRLADALQQQAFAALCCSPGARAFYDSHRARGATHHQALGALANRLVGILHGCLTHHTPYNEHTAWAHRDTQAA
jgi:hypothetical protein